MPPIKPYRTIPIRECGEALTPLLPGAFAFFDPHPYVALGAPYGAASPWMLRQSVAQALQKAQEMLGKTRPGWRIKLFDAYRPNAVQDFMVEHELTMLARADGHDPAQLNAPLRAAYMEKVLRIFAAPSADPASPPPHSCGAAIDCTLQDQNGVEVDMGCVIDENSDRADPDFYATADDATGKSAHANRQLLNDVMQAQGLKRNPREWWHFSRGDQLAVWIEHGLTPGHFAIYGRVQP